MLKVEAIRRLEIAKTSLIRCVSTYKSKRPKSGTKASIIEELDDIAIKSATNEINTVIVGLTKGVTPTHEVEFKMCKTLDDTKQCVLQLGAALAQLHVDFAQLKRLSDGS